MAEIVAFGERRQTVDAVASRILAVSIVQYQIKTPLIGTEANFDSPTASIKIGP